MLTWPARLPPTNWPTRVALTVAVPPVEEPISLEEVRSWLRIDHEAEETSVLDALIRAARHQVEEDTGLKYLTQTVDQTVDRVPCGWEPLQLYVGPVQSVTSVTVYSSADVSSVLSGSTYFVDTSRRAARLCLTTGSAWPTDLRYQVAAVVRVVAGYAGISSIPEPLIHALRLLIEHWHDDCEGDASQMAPGISMAYESLIRPYRLEWL